MSNRRDDILLLPKYQLWGPKRKLRLIINDTRQMAADWETCLYCQSPSGRQRQRNTPLIASSACKMPLLIKTESKMHFRKASKARASNRLTVVCVCVCVRVEKWNSVDCGIWRVFWGEVPIMPRGQRRPFRMLRLASLAARRGRQQKVAWPWWLRWPGGPPLTESVRTRSARWDVLFVRVLPWGWKGWTEWKV